MKYFKSTLILDEAGKDIITILPIEIDADAVIGMLKSRIEEDRNKLPFCNTKSVMPKSKVPKKKRTLTCAECGKDGHMKKTCPAMKRVVGDPDFKPAPVEHSTTNKLTATVALDLPEKEEEEEIREESPVTDQYPDEVGALGGVQFLKVKDGQRQEKTAVDMAAMLRVEIREINVAMRCDTHREYLKERKM